MKWGPPAALSRRDLALLLLGALLVRLVGLGHVSMWLDEILGTRQMARGLGAGLAALWSDAVHPPLWLVFDWLWSRLSEAEAWRRGLPALAGAFAVVLLAALAARWFGRAVAGLAALLAALSPFQVRYSQELRPYALTVLLAVLLLLLVDRARERPGRMPWLAVALAWAALLGTTHFAALLLPPALLLVLEPRRPRARRGAELRRLLAALAGGGILAAPSVALALTAAAKAHEASATAWTLAAVWRRWEFLALGGSEAAPATAWSLAAAAVALAGLWAAVRTHRGRVVVAGAAAGTLGAELVLRHADHWSNARYNVLAWPFLMLLLALGCHALGEAMAAGVRRTGRERAAARIGRWSRSLVAAALVLLACRGLWTYYRAGRPDWRAVAGAIASLPAGTPVYAANEWTRICLAHYLAEAEREGEPGGVSIRVLGPDPGRELAGTAARCAAVVAAGYPARGDLGALFGRTPLALRFPRTGATLAVLGLEGGEVRGAKAWECAAPGFETGHEERGFPLSGLLRARDGGASQPLRIELDAGSAEVLVSGWSYPERTPEGMTFRWAVGEWAGVRVPGTASTSLSLVVWPYAAPRTMRVYRNREPLATLELAAGLQEIRIPLPARPVPPPADLFHFEFPGNAEPPAHPRLLAAGFDRIELTP